jgi:hypothetical protein
MKIPVLVGTLVLSSLVGASAFASPEHGHGDQDRGPRKEKVGGHGREGDRASREQHGHRDRGNRPEQGREGRQDERQVDRRPPKREQIREANWHERDEHGPRDIWQMHRARDWKHEHHSWRERGGYHGYRIPDDRFHAHFGRGHWFRVHSVPVIVVDGRPRFQYAGFWFTIVEPWPEYWAPTWYESDDVYVDYVNDGYYLCNRRHPGVTVAVNVSF